MTSNPKYKQNFFYYNIFHLLPACDISEKHSQHLFCICLYLSLLAVAMRPTALCLILALSLLTSAAVNYPGVVINEIGSVYFFEQRWKMEFLFDLDKFYCLGRDINLYLKEKKLWLVFSNLCIKIYFHFYTFNYCGFCLGSGQSCWYSSGRSE